MDTVTPERRSEIMARIRSKDTRPEIMVRKLVWSLGCRYRLHCTDIPGKPDLVFKGRKKAIFVHGCFWHGHDCRAGKNRPGSHMGYWSAKLEKTVNRDKRNLNLLQSQGWKTLVVWECELKNPDLVKQRLADFLHV